MHKTYAEHDAEVLTTEVRAGFDLEPFSYVRKTVLSHDIGLEGTLGTGLAQVLGLEVWEGDRGCSILSGLSVLGQTGNQPPQ